MTPHTMSLREIIDDIHAMTEDCEIYERKYGVLSETFYESYMNGEEPADEDWVLDWAGWAGAYKVLLRRREQYRHVIEELRERTSDLATVIERTAHREPILVAS